MLTLLKKFSLGGIKTLWHKIKNYFFLENLLEQTLLEINIMKIKKEKDGLFTQMRLMQVKYLWSGILGCISRQIKSKKIMIWKNMNGKNLINQITLEQKRLIIQIKIKMLLTKNIKLGNLNLNIN